MAINYFYMLGTGDKISALAEFKGQDLFETNRSDQVFNEDNYVLEACSLASNYFLSLSGGSVTKELWKQWIIATDPETVDMVNEVKVAVVKQMLHFARLGLEYSSQEISMTQGSISYNTSGNGTAGNLLAVPEVLIALKRITKYLDAKFVSMNKMTSGNMNNTLFGNVNPFPMANWSSGDYLVPVPGPKGDKGVGGDSFVVKGTLDNSSLLPPVGNEPGFAYVITNPAPSQIAVWDGSAWVLSVWEGEKGDKGDTGDTGTTGNTGPAGNSLYYRGQLATVGDLPPTGNNIADMFTITGVVPNPAYIWDGTAWVAASWQGIQGIKGDTGPPGAPGVVQSIVAGSSNVLIGGTPDIPSISVKDSLFIALTEGVDYSLTWDAPDSKITFAMLTKNYSEYFLQISNSVDPNGVLVGVAQHIISPTILSGFGTGTMGSHSHIYAKNLSGVEGVVSIDIQTLLPASLDNIYVYFLNNVLGSLPDMTTQAQWTLKLWGSN